MDNSIKRVFNPDDQMLGEYNTHASDVYFKGISTLLPQKQSAPQNNSGKSNMRDQYAKFHITRYKILFQIQTRYQDLAFKLDYSQFQWVLIKYYSIPEPPDWFLKTIEQIISHPLQTPLGVSLKFDLSTEAATHNMNILRGYTNSVHLYINANKHSFMGYGSEFHPIHIIERLLMHHRSWPSFLNQLQQGSKWPLTSISESDRKAKNTEFIQRGNHKSAITHHSILRDIIQKKVRQGWMIPIPIDCINELPHSEIAPVGIDDSQFKVHPDGSKTPKFRLTHDQTFEASVGCSVNHRTQKDKLDPLFYGGYLSRLLHYIVSIRARHPSTKILGGKSQHIGE